MSIFNTIICRYNEIATKGNNRAMFERRLAENIRNFCYKICVLKVNRVRGRIFLYKDKKELFSDTEVQDLTAALKRCFGLASFSFCLEAEPTVDNVMAMIRKMAIHTFTEKFEYGMKSVRFRTRARRSDKNFPMRSRDIEIESATIIEELYGDKIHVDLDHPDISIGVEVRDNTAIVHCSSEDGPGGLPVGSNSPVLALLSGGIDSPVACSMIMKRGCRMDFLTFHSYPYTPMESVEKVARIAKVLNTWQIPGKLFACNISGIQKLIRDNCNCKFRTILYRRIMMKIANRICEEYGLHAIVTGEAVGQVASQTVENMGVINASSAKLILRPLCGMDKNETIYRAMALGTFDISIEPMADSCTVFAPDSPVLKAKLHTAEFEESRIPDLEKAIEEAVSTIEIVDC